MLEDSDTLSGKVRQDIFGNPIRCPEHRNRCNVIFANYRARRKPPMGVCIVRAE